ncbi:hypothetical protein [Solibacillus sp. CAU 1738]|uniref:hypothetical protein n=1 Tax=Solibacillus sp. CAU 1738 TaxID=3140363 RepID=UPI003260AB52
MRRGLSGQIKEIEQSISTLIRLPRVIAEARLQGNDNRRSTTDGARHIAVLPYLKQESFKFSMRRGLSGQIKEIEQSISTLIRLPRVIAEARLQGNVNRRSTMDGGTAISRASFL